MLRGYTTNADALRPLMAELDAVLLTAKEAAQHLRYSAEQLSNLRRSGKGPAFIRLPTGGIRYKTSALLAWQASGEAGALNLERVELAIASAVHVPEPCREALLEHVRLVFAVTK